MNTQRNVSDKGGTMRLGNWVCCLTPGTKAYQAYDEAIVFERHRHRYEFNSDYQHDFEAAGLVVTGVNPELKLAEIMEIPDHPWFIAVQFHPEFTSTPRDGHPLFQGFVRAARQHRTLSLPQAVSA